MRNPKAFTWRHMMILLAAAMIIVGLGMIYDASAALAADDSDCNPTVVEFRQSGAPYGPYSEWEEATINCAEQAADATLLIEYPDFAWVRHKAGPDACIFNSAQAGLTHAAGGRECQARYHEGRCGYYMPHYGSIYGVSGGACAAYHIPVCTGICQ